MVPAPFITFEGGEGSGKSTQLKRAEAYLKDRGYRIWCTREPGGTSGAEGIRKLLLQGDPEKWDAWTELLLMNASRQDHVIRGIKPKIEKGFWVLSDRYADSSRVYQGIVGGVGLEKADKLMFELMGVPKPDLTILFDVPACVGVERACARLGTESSDDAEDRFEQKGLRFHEEIRESYLRLARMEPKRFVVLEADKEQNIVHEEVISILEKFILCRNARI